MLLLVADPGPLSSAVEAQYASQGEAVRVAPTSSDDLFDLALGTRGIVYLAAPSMLHGRTAPEPDPARIGRVLSAANAPGVTVVVAVVPDHEAYDEELRVLRRNGKPFAALRCAPLLEEIGAALPERGSVWMPRVGHVRACALAAAAAAITEAVDTEEQGRVTTPPCSTLDALTLFRQASERSGRQIRVRAAWRWAYLLLRRVGRWLRGREPLAARLAEALVPELALPPARRPPALPAST